MIDALDNLLPPSSGYRKMEVISSSETLGITCKTMEKTTVQVRVLVLMNLK
jgi:hypothetical protein